MGLNNNLNNNYSDIDTSLLSDYERKNIELKLQTQSKRHRFVKIEIVDDNNSVIAEASGTAISGNYNIDSSSAIRRTCSISFKLEQGNLPSETSLFWINKKFQLFIGLKQFETNKIYWFNKGQYVIKDPTVNISISEKTITINGLDKMSLYNGDISGQLTYSTIIETESGAYVHDAIRGIMRDGGETNLLIANTDLQIPYKIESSIGDTRWDIISKLTDLFYNYQAYYNVDGYFVFDKKPMYQSNENFINNIAINFSKEYINSLLETKPYNLIISINREILYSNIKNQIVVYGGVHSDGYQPRYEIIIDDEHYPNSPYTVEKLNEKNSDGSFIYRTLVIQDDSYIDDGVAENETDTMETVHKYSINLCKQRAEQEVYLHQQATDKVTMTCLPIYSLDVNDVVYFDDNESGVVGEYVVNNISCGLGIGDTMSITLNKLW